MYDQVSGMFGMWSTLPKKGGAVQETTLCTLSLGIHLRAEVPWATRKILSYLSPTYQKWALVFIRIPYRQKQQGLEAPFRAVPTSSHLTCVHSNWVAKTLRRTVQEKAAAPEMPLLIAPKYRLREGRLALGLGLLSLDRGLESGTNSVFTKEMLLMFL